MKLDDESELSAYLDDELDEPRRLVVEAALLNDPRLALRLRDMARVRDLLGDLPRPTCPVDLSEMVLSVLIDPKTERSLPGRMRPMGRLARPSLAAWGSGLAVAAGVLVAFSLWLLARPQAGGIPGALPVRADLASVANRPGLGPGLEADAGRIGLDSGSEVVPDVPVSELVASGRSAGPDEEEIQSDRERQSMLGLLDNPSVRRIFVTSDMQDVAAAGVDEALRTIPRKKSRYGRLTVNQGIVVDPESPQGATVFILVMDDRELEHLRVKLEEEYSLKVKKDADPADPSVVTLLADIGQVDVIAGTPATTTVRPLPEEMAPRVALKHGNEAPVFAKEKMIVPGHTGATPSSANPRSGGLAISDNRREADQRPAAFRPDDGEEEPGGPTRRRGPETYLVWVTSGRGRNGDR